MVLRAGGAGRRLLWRENMVAVGVTSGHHKSLEMLRQATSVQASLAMYREALGQQEVFLRPTDNGLTVLPLDRSAPKFVHAGHLTTIPPEPRFVANKVAAYQTELEGAFANPKPEEQFSLCFLRSALAHGLRLSGSGELFDAMRAIYAPGGELDGVRLDVSISARAEVWTPMDRIRIPAVAGSPAQPSPLGPQNPGDGTFAARMRHHQSW